MNELLNLLSLPEANSASPIPSAPKAEAATGEGGFALLLMQLAQMNPPVLPPGMTIADLQQGEAAPSAGTTSVPTTGATATQLSPALVSLLQSLGSVGSMTGQPTAMDGTPAGSLPIVAAEIAPELPNPGNGTPEILVTARQLLALATAADPNAAATIVGAAQGQTLPTASIAMATPDPSADPVQYQLPADLVLSQNDLAKLQTLLSQALALQTVSTATPLAQPQAVAAASILPASPEELKQTLQKLFPTLKIEDLSAQLQIKSPELVKSEPAPTLVGQKSNIDFLPQVPSAQIARFAAEAAQPVITPTDSTPANFLANSNATGTPAQSPAQAATLTSGGAFENAISIVSPDQPNVAIEPRSAEDAATVTGSLTKAESVELEKTAVKSTHISSDIPQTSQHWSELFADRSAAPLTEQIAEPRQPFMERPQIKIQFDRFQIDALLRRSEIKLQLDPPELGNMRVKLVSTPQEVTARFETTTEAARHAVEQNLPQLRESLHRAGIRVDQVQVVLDDQRARQQQAQYQNPRRQQSDSDEPSRQTSRRESTPIRSVGTVVASALQGLNLLA